MKGRNDNENDSKGKVGNRWIRFSQRFPARFEEDMRSQSRASQESAYQAMKHKIAARISKDPKPPKT